MNWDAIGAIAELLGAVGVIASLVYLATQIRQSREQMERNTRAVSASGFQDSLEQFDHAFFQVFQDSELASLTLQGFEGTRELSEEDQIRFGVLMAGVMSSLENTYYQYRIGLLDKDRWSLHQARLETLIGRPGVARWWRQGQFAGLVAPQFVS
ncbi:MAG: hypothetical protein JRG86_06545 [Deltaproteobacteria bacterium]|jgi:hypothetical protein|nr:hypothetical protein [Deltaproteobacteria bacterium]